MREYLTLHRSVFPSYLTIESGRIVYMHEMNVQYKLPWLIPHCLFAELLHQEYSSSSPEYKAVFVQESTNKRCLQIPSHITVFELTLTACDAF